MKTLLLILLLFSSAIAMSQDKVAHYYIEIKGKNPKNYQYTMGEITYDDEFRPTKIPNKNLNTYEDIVNTLTDEYGLETLPQLNVIVHGIWGNFEIEWRNMIQNLTRYVYSPKKNQKSVILSIIWDAHIIYTKGIPIARSKGDHLAPLLKSLQPIRQKGVELNFLCHSMGNRVFEHMIKSYGAISRKEICVDHYISVAADLPNDIFQEGSNLSGIEYAVQDITLYIHNNDRTLGVSGIINRDKRLGLYGPEDFNLTPSNMRIINVSAIDDNVDISSKLTNHRYFYFSPTIMEDLHRIILLRDFVTNKVELDSERHLKLLPKE